MGVQIKKAVITGGSSSVGLALIKKLLSENVEVLLLQRKESFKRKRLPEHKLLTTEFCSLQELKDYMPKETNYDAFFHLAWIGTIKNERDSIECQMDNVIYSCDAAELAHRFGCSVFVGTGSQAEYGRHEEALRTDTLCMPENAYGVMKLCSGHASRLVCKKYGIRHIWPRILSGYGIYDNTSSVLISTILNSLHGKAPVFSKGEQIWDFIYMDDIANALFLIAEKGKDGMNYPIGSGDAKPLKEYLEILCNKLGNLHEAEFGKLSYGKDQIMHLEADVSELQRDTGWKPEVKFETGIEETIEFYKNSLNDSLKNFEVNKRSKETEI